MRLTKLPIIPPIMTSANSASSSLSVPSSTEVASHGFRSSSFVKNGCPLIKNIVKRDLIPYLNPKQVQVLSHYRNWDFKRFNGGLRLLPRDQSFEVLETALYYRVSDVKVLNRFLSALLNRNDFEYAGKLISYVPRDIWNIRTYHVAASYYKKIGQHSDSLELLNSLDRSTWDRPIYLIGVELKMALGQYREAMELFFSFPDIDRSYLSHLLDFRCDCEIAETIFKMGKEKFFASLDYHLDMLGQHLELKNKGRI